MVDSSFSKLQPKVFTLNIKFFTKELQDVD